MPDASLLTSLFPDEVVTRALVRDVELPDGAGTMALITLDNGRDHTRPNTFGPAGLLSLNDALDAVRGADRHRRRRGHRQAVHLRGRRRPERRAADRRAGRGADHRPARARGVPAARRAERAVVRVRERRRARRRPGTGAALLVPDDLLRGHRGRVPRVLPRPAARLGRHLPAAAPDRPGERAEGHRREPAQPEPHAARRAGLLARHRRRDVRARRLPGRVAALGGPGADRRGRRCPGRSRAAGWDAGELGPVGGRGAAVRRRQAARRRSGALPGHRPGGRGPRPDPRRGVRRRGRGPRRPAAQRGTAGRALRLRPDPEAGQARGRGAGSVSGPAGHQGRGGGCRADGRADRAAVRAAARGARGADGPGPGPAGRRARSRAGRGGQAPRARPDQRRRRGAADRAGHRVADQGRVRRRRLRDRGRVRGDGGQAAGVRRGRGGGPAGVRAGHQHLLAVGDRDGVGAGASRAGRRASTSSTRWP